MIQAGFLLLTFVMALLVYAGMAHAANRATTDAKQRRRYKVRTALVLDAWLIYVSVLSLAGVLATDALPPRMPLLLILPAFGFITWFFLSGRFTAIIAAVPMAWLVYAQSFRIVVELLLLGLCLKGILPQAATFEGYNYDIAAGITALPMGYLACTRRLLPAVVLIIWNILGLCTLVIIVFIIISHIYLPALWPGSQLSMAQVGVFPYTLLAGFLMPLAVFLHVFSLVKPRYTIG